MRAVLVVAGHAVFFLAGIPMWIMAIMAFARWWDFWGVVAAVVLPPLAIAFPFIAWVKDGAFPWMFFAIWGIGLAGLVVAGIASSGGTPDS